MKTYVITLSKHFPAKHSRAGKETFFKEAIANGINGDAEKYEYQHYKIHTIRSNYEFWKRRVDEINAGKAVLSIRQWSGKPYQSKQVEIQRLSNIGIQKGSLSYMSFSAYADILHEDGTGVHCEIKDLANNDGLTESEFREWFKGYDLSNSLAIIHFTDFRY